MNRIFSEAWPERKTRFLSVVGAKSTTGGKTVVRAARGESGPLVFGPYMPLKGGAHSAEFTISIHGADSPNATVVTCDVVGSGGRQIASKSFSSAEIMNIGGKVHLDFELPELEFGIQARCISSGKASVECGLPVAIL